MKDSGEVADKDIDVRDLLRSSRLTSIHVGQRHSVFRTTYAERSFVVKMTAPHTRTAESMRHEYEFLRNLHLPGIVRALGLAQVDDGAVLVMEDAGPDNLATVLRSAPISVADSLTIAVQLAEAVASLHALRIVHRNINPSNVVWHAAAQGATLIDFGMATTLLALSVEGAGPAQVEGALAYVSPEQTGRTGRAVDWRTDLYSLGATLYELLTGAPPFSTEDPIELVHAHLARLPRPPHQLTPVVPPTLSNIVMKLLEKAPEQRYQTADAVILDLREAKSQWLKTGKIEPFLLASHDVASELAIPEKLFGRDEQLRTLNEAFARACQGGRELVLVTGAAGVGKSALVNHLRHTVSEHHGNFIAGKFDLLQRSVPFSALGQGLRAMVRQLLTETGSSLASWRQRIEAAVEPNGRLVVDVVPELERILGSQPPVPDLGPVESRNRFNLVLTRFLRVFAQPKHPLLLFLDDLQWADAGSLQLLEQWITDADIHCLLLLGAYRDSEVTPAHPLALTFAGLRDAGTTLHEIHLGPIGRDDVAQLAAEAFDTELTHTHPLADLVMQKTRGNPFFVRRLIHLLHSQGFIRFVPQLRKWEWELAELERAPLADNVLDLMVETIDRLPEATRTLLQVAACIGHQFDLGTLADVSGHTAPTAAAELWPALEDGLLLPTREAQRMSGRTGPLEERFDAPPAILQFIHDRVQQAAYSSLSEERRRDLHVAIGRRLLSGAGHDQLDERLFEIVDQLDLGEARIVDPTERLRVVELNLTAGRKAKASAAYQAGFEYLSVARRFLPSNSWEGHSELTFALHRDLAECAYLVGQHATAEELIETALEHTTSRLAKLDLYRLRALAATVAGDFKRALEWGRDGLAVAGLDWPREGLAEANEAEATAVKRNLGERRIENLVDEPEVKDEVVRACMHLLSILGPPAYFVGADVLTFVMTRATNLSLAYGPSPYSAYAYVFYGALHNARTGQYEIGYAFGKLALALARRFGNRAEESRVLEVFGLVVQPWKAPLRDSLPLFREGFRAGVEYGELAYAAFNLSGALINGLPAGVPLSDLLADADVAADFATRHKNRTGIELCIPFRQIARALMGATRTQTTFDDEKFEEAIFLEEAKDNQTAMGQFWVARLQAAVIVGDYDTARRSSGESAKRIATGILGMVTSAEHVFYTALTLAAHHNLATTADATSLDELRALHVKLGSWADHCPDNFAHKQALVGAEIARLSGASIEAMRLYRTAIDGAKRNRFTQDEALAHELRGRFLLEEDEPELARVHFRAARDAYSKWGATVKVRALDAAHPNLLAGDARPVGQALALDALALIKASQAISAETIPERLFEQILRIVVELAGAQEGALLLSDSDAITVRARIKTNDGVTFSLAEIPLEECPELPAAIIRYVARVKAPLVLADATTEPAFAVDQAVELLRSVMCVPLSRHGKVVGLLYLANHALSGAFTNERAEVVQVLAAQAVISLENTLANERLEEARNVAQTANRAKDEFLAMLGHELRNPLAPISTALHLMRLRGRPDDDRERLVIERQVSHLTRLVDDLLDVARFTRGKVELKRVRIELAEIAAKAVEIASPLLEQRRQMFEIDVPRTGLLVDADPTRMAQVLSNLLNNAAKYTEPGGSISLKAALEGEDVVVRIRDTGLGISQEMLPQVFELFKQERQELDRSQGGLGLGLAIVRSLVAMHGGTVGAASEGRGLGSEFVIRLPAISASTSALEETAFVPPAGRRQYDRRVLVVDDNVDGAEMLSHTIQALGCTTRVAHDGPSALRIAQDWAPDVALLDIGLPVMNGYELARRLRKLPSLKRTKFIAVTGYGQDSDRQQSAEAGFDQHLVKPIGLEEIEQAISDPDGEQHDN